jgi:hypothetical protein
MNTNEIKPPINRTPKTKMIAGIVIAYSAGGNQFRSGLFGARNG